MEFRHFMKQRRLDLGLTLEDVAKAVGVGKATVQRWESGDIKNMRRDKIALLASVLQVSPAAIVNARESTAGIGEILTVEEKRLLTAYRAADNRAREDALKMLLDHPQEQESTDLA